MIRTLLVDDEELARSRLRRLLSAHSDVEVVGEASDANQALDQVTRHRPDLLFLDIEMPARSGLELAAALPPPRPHVIFCTAYDAYALDAFELNAVDYLLKPVHRKRLSRSLERIRQRTMTAEIEAARRTQERLHPLYPNLPGLDFSGYCDPARGVGGDYFDFLPLSANQLGIAVGDVAGKGIYAGLLMAGLQGRLQSQAPVHGNDLAKLFGDLNRQVWASTESNRYATLFYGVLDADRALLSYVNAGHQPPLLISPSNPGALRLEQGGTALGLFAEATFEEGSVELAGGDILLLFTDGIVETHDADGAEFGLSRLEGIVRRAASAPAAELSDEIRRSVSEFSGGEEQEDDQTLVVVRFAE